MLQLDLRIGHRADRRSKEMLVHSHAQSWVAHMQHTVSYLHNPTALHLFDQSTALQLEVASSEDKSRYRSAGRMKVS